MPINITPGFSRVGDIQWSTLTAANTAKDGTGTVATIFTADTQMGGLVDKVVVMPVGTNIQTVLRIFINNGSSNAVAGNNTLYKDITIPATTLSETTQLGAIEITLNLALPPGYKLNCALGTAIAAGVALTAVGGKF